MKNMLAITLFMLAMLAWAVAQQPRSAADGSSGQATSPSSQAGASQSQPSSPGSADQDGSQDQKSNARITEGCLGGGDPNYTLTDKTGVTYKLNMPPNADTSKLPSHVGESVKVLGDVKGTGKASGASIDVQRIGPGTDKCPGSGSPQSPPKQ